MNINAINMPNMGQSQLSKGSSDVSAGRKKAVELVESAPVEKQQVQSEELLNQIKALTEDGLYSVRFQNDERSSGLVVQIVDRQNDEVIRQVPTEELLDLHDALQSLRGNLVNTQS